MADLIDRNYLIEKFSDTGEPAVSEMGKGYDIGIRAALRVVKNAPAVNRWIPCSERLPHGGGRVLATTKQGYVVDVIFVLKGSQWFRNGEYFPTDTVIAWMPMPDAYEPPEKD